MLLTLDYYLTCVVSLVKRSRHLTVDLKYILDVMESRMIKVPLMWQIFSPAQSTQSHLLPNHALTMTIDVSIGQLTAASVNM